MEGCYYVSNVGAHHCLDWPSLSQSCNNATHTFLGEGVFVSEFVEQTQVTQTFFRTKHIWGAVGIRKISLTKHTKVESAAKSF